MFGDMLDGKGKPKYEKLFAMVKAGLILSDGNADTKRRFSVNKYLMKIHGVFTSVEAIKDLRLVKDHFIRIAGFDQFEIGIDKTAWLIHRHGLWNYF